MFNAKRSDIRGEASFSLSVRKSGFSSALVAMIAVALFMPGAQKTSFAFHSGGVAPCEGCHTMHNSQNSMAMTQAGGATQFIGKNYLLLGSDPSSVCLNCHKGSTGGYQVMSGATGPQGMPSQLTPGGDFAWLNIVTSYVTSTGIPGVNAGTRHGHNIVAADYNLAPSTVFATAPGGAYPSASLFCTSCHDPHGEYRVNGSYQFAAPATGQNVGPVLGSGSHGTRQPTATETVGVYRLLGGVNYLPLELKGTNLGFIYPPPFAFAPLPYNRSEDTTDTRVAYGSGMSAWCSNCHGGIHGDTYPTNQPHPSGGTTSQNLTSALSNQDSQAITIATRYNNYISSGNLTGSSSTSYTSMAPYEEGQPMNAISYADLATRAVNDGSQKGGPTYYANGGNELVMCLTCHRAHASAWPKIMRWNAEYDKSLTYITYQSVYVGIDASVPQARYGEYNLGYLQAQVQLSFYNRPVSSYAAFQRSLCYKCHNTSTDS